VRTPRVVYSCSTTRSSQLSYGRTRSLVAGKWGSCFRVTALTPFNYFELALSPDDTMVELRSMIAHKGGHDYSALTTKGAEYA
jgi:hypothetical protein